MVKVAGNRGFTLIELLTAILIAILIIGALLGLYVASNRAFGVSSDISSLTEDMRNTVTTLDFIFSRWGVGVPCRNNDCSAMVSNVNNGILPDCDSTYPPSDPMCVTVGSSSLTFYASLGGMGVVTNSTSKAVSCRLKSGEPYYLWNGTKLANWDGISLPVSNCTLSLSEDNRDCFSGPDNSIVDISTSCSLFPGAVLIRAPHRITMYLSGDVLYMDRYDVALNQSENSVKLADRVRSFSVSKDGRNLKVSIDFVSEGGRVFHYERYFGR